MKNIGGHDKTENSRELITLIANCDLISDHVCMHTICPLY